MGHVDGFAHRGQEPSAAERIAGNAGGPVLAPRRVFDFESEHRAPREVVFPLLCPVREYDWIEDWRCEVLYTESGVAEDDGVFATDFEGRSTWVVTVHEPPERIEFCIFNERQVVARLKIRLEESNDGSCRLRWRRIYTAVGSHGARVLEVLDPIEVEASMRLLVARLDHWLAHGRPLHVTVGSEEVTDGT